MAKFLETDSKITILATATDGSAVELYARLLKIPYREFRGASTLKQTSSILDVRGSKDDAGSVAEITPTSGFKVEVGQPVSIRLKETPEELRKVFDEARVNMPNVTKSFGVKLREIQAAVFGAPTA
jgi:hypothetical protein